MEEGRNSSKLLTGKHLGRPRGRQDVSIIMDLEGVNTRNWVDSAQDSNY